MSSFLRSVMRTKPSSSRRADVAGVEPSVAQGLGRVLRPVVVATKMLGPRTRISPSSAIRTSTLDSGRPTVPNADAAERHDAKDRRRLGQAVALENWQPESRRPRRRSLSQRRATGDDEPQATAEPLEPPEDELVGQSTTGSAPGTAPPSGRTAPADGRRQSTSRRASRRGPGERPPLASTRASSFSNTRGTPVIIVGRTGQQVARDRVDRLARRSPTRQTRYTYADHAFERVTERQERQRDVGLVEVEPLLQPRRCSRPGCRA